MERKRNLVHFGVVTLKGCIQLRLLTIPRSSLPNTIMIIKIYPDLRWEITNLDRIDPPSYSLEYDVVREFDGLVYTDRISNVIFLVNKSREISPVLVKALPCSEIIRYKMSIAEKMHILRTNR